MKRTLIGIAITGALLWAGLHLFRDPDLWGWSILPLAGALIYKRYEGYREGLEKGAELAAEFARDFVACVQRKTGEAIEIDLDDL
jgi:hypothetical protein